MNQDSTPLIDVDKYADDVYGSYSTCPGADNWSQATSDRPGAPLGQDPQGRSDAGDNNSTDSREGLGIFGMRGKTSLGEMDFGTPNREATPGGGSSRGTPELFAGEFAGRCQGGGPLGEG